MCLIFSRRGLSPTEIVEELPDLELDDVKASLAFAARRVDHPLIAAASGDYLVVVRQYEHR